MQSFNTLIDALESSRLADRTITFIESADQEVTISYQQLYERAQNLLGWLQSQDVRAGNELIFFLRDNESFIEAFWACLMGGIIPVPVAVGISDEHRSKVFRIFKQLKSPFLYADKKSMELVEAYAKESALEDEFKCIQSRSLLVEDKQLDKPGKPIERKASDIAFIQFSSGSTRDPKGIVLTHKNILTTNIAMGSRIAYTSDDISLSWMPLTHDLGIIGYHLNMVVFGMSQNIMTTDLFSRRPLLWLQKASEKKATILSSPNFGYRHYLKLYESKGGQDLDLSHVKIIMNGAEPISVSLCHQFMDVMGQHGLPRTAIYPGYGLAEASLGVALPVPGHEMEYIIVNRHQMKLGDTVSYIDESNADAIRFAVEGPVLKNCEVRISNLNDEDVGADTIGEIHIRGENVTAGYYANEEANQALFSTDGWLKTGDLGLLHDNKLVITGRLKDIIFANGLNYYPHDLEAIALKSAGMELGKIVAAGARKQEAENDDILVFVLHRGALTEFAAIAREVEAAVSEHAGLQVTHVIPVNRIPKTTSGKIQRRFLVDAYLKNEYAQAISELSAMLKADGHTETAEALSAKETELMAICHEVLTDKKVKLDDNLFEIGASSLDIAQIHGQIDEQYPDVMDITDIFDHSSVREMATFLEQKVSE